MIQENKSNRSQTKGIQEERKKERKQERKKERKKERKQIERM